MGTITPPDKNDGPGTPTTPPAGSDPGTTGSASSLKRYLPYIIGAIVLVTVAMVLGAKHVI